MRTKVKVFLAALFLSMIWLWAKLPPQMGPQHPRAVGGRPQLNLSQMETNYAVYNSAWFEGKLSKNIQIGLTDNPMVQADSTLEHGRWIIRFNPRYNTAPTTADFNLFHEMCHIATPKDLDHGPVWEACMENLALSGAFHDVW